MSHKYDDNCGCQECTDTWNKALFAMFEAVDPNEKAAAKKKAKNKRRKSK